MVPSFSETMEIHTVDIEPMKVAGLSHKGSYSEIGRKFEELSKWQDHTELKNAPLVALYYDDPHNVPEKDLRSFAGVVMSADYDLKDRSVEQATVPGGKYAMTSFTGQYSKLPKAWEEFYGNIFGKGMKTKADLCFERYINLPGEVPPDELITELYAPLA